jgi:hypothetical protein
MEDGRSNFRKQTEKSIIERDFSMKNKNLIKIEGFLKILKDETAEVEK